MKDILEPIFIELLEKIEWKDDDLFDVVVSEHTDKEDSILGETDEIQSGCVVGVKDNTNFKYTPNRNTPTEFITKIELTLGFMGNIVDIKEKHDLGPRLVVQEIFKDRTLNYQVIDCRVDDIKSSEFQETMDLYLYTTTIYLSVKCHWVAPVLDVPADPEP